MSTQEGAVDTRRFNVGQLARLQALRDYGIVFSFIALFIMLSVASNVFFTRQNLLNILDQRSATSIIAVGGTLVFIAGGFDLSVGSIYAVAGVVAALMAPHIGTWGAILLGVGMGLGCGVVNGVLVTIGRINAFIATLATSIMIAGIALVLTSGNLITVIKPASFPVLGRSDFVTVKYSVWTFLAFALTCGFLLSRTTFGRMMYASGGNPEAARLSGIRVALDAVAGIVIGGTSIMGGAGAVRRTVLGVLLLAMIGNGFNLLNVDSTYQRIFQGAIILIAVGIDAWSRRSS